MASLDTQANAVLQEFGGILPESLLSAEDVRREYLYVRALELQKLGVSDTDKTVSLAEIDIDTRDGLIIVPSGMEALMPAYVELQPTGTTEIGDRLEVGIRPLEDIQNYEGSRAIAFYGEPLKYRLAFNSWEVGTLYLGYDPVEDLSLFRGDSEVAFPLNFSIFLVKKTALKVIDIIRLKLLMLDTNEWKDRVEGIERVLDKLQLRLVSDTAEWQKEFERWMNKDLNERPVLRRSTEEIMAREIGELGGRGLPSFLRS